MPTVQAKALKCTVVLDADEFIALPPPEGVPRVVLRIRLPDRTVTADLNAKSVRKARATIEAAGEAGCSLIVQGKLVGDRIEEAGLVAQPKVPKVVPAEAAD